MTDRAAVRQIQQDKIGIRDKWSQDVVQIVRHATGHAEVWKSGIYDDEQKLVDHMGPGEAFGDEALVKLIREYTREAGLRNLVHARRPSELGRDVVARAVGLVAVAGEGVDLAEEPGVERNLEAYLPGIYDRAALTDKVNVEDDAAYEMARRLAREEADAEVARREWERLGREGEASPLTLREPQVAEAEPPRFERPPEVRREGLLARLLRRLGR